MFIRTLFALNFIAAILFTSSSANAWYNGQNGNPTTNTDEECLSPPYSTHDWIADHALSFLPEHEKAWLLPYKHVYFLGTEAPDNKNIPISCGTPNTGYDDRLKGHNVEWNGDWSDFKVINGDRQDRAAVRAEEEYTKARQAYSQGNPKAAAFYLGAMASYIGNVSSYAHTIQGEKNQSLYEGWVSQRTKKFYSNYVFRQRIGPNLLAIRTPYNAVARISLTTSKGVSSVKSAKWMDDNYYNKSEEEYIISVSVSLNEGINDLADVLHTFYINEVQ